MASSKPPSGDQRTREYLQLLGRHERRRAVILSLVPNWADANADAKKIDASRTAEREGPMRLTRCKRCFQMGEKLARAKGWPFYWRLVEAPGVGYSGSAMFVRPQCQAVLFGH